MHGRQPATERRTPNTYDSYARNGKHDGQEDQIRPRAFQRDTEEMNSPYNDGATRVQNRNVLEEDKIHGLGEGQGGEGEVEPAQPDCRQGDDDPHCSGEASGGQEPQP